MIDSRAASFNVSWKYFCNKNNINLTRDSTQLISSDEIHFRAFISENNFLTSFPAQVFLIFPEHEKYYFAQVFLSFFTTVERRRLRIVKRPSRTFPLCVFLLAAVNSFFIYEDAAVKMEKLWFLQEGEQTLRDDFSPLIALNTQNPFPSKFSTVVV